MITEVEDFKKLIVLQIIFVRIDYLSLLRLFQFLIETEDISYTEFTNY